MDRINVDRVQLRRDIVTVTGWADELARSRAPRGELLEYQRFKVDVLNRIAAWDPGDKGAAGTALQARLVLADMEEQVNAG